VGNLNNLNNLNNLDRRRSIRLTRPSDVTVRYQEKCYNP
jgi:hypothetical protein